MNLQNRTIDWLLAGCPTFAVTIAIALLLGQNMLKSGAIALATSATSMASAAILHGRQMTRLVLLEQQVTERNKAEQLRQELPNLQAEYHKLSGENEKISLLIKEKIQELELKQASLGRAKGQLAELNQRSQEMKQAIAIFTEKKQELEQRIATLNKNYPDLAQLEQLQAKIAELQLQKAEIQGEIKALEDKFASMQERQVLMQELEAKILDQRVELERVTTQLQQLEAQKKQQEIEHDSLRNQVDRLRQQASIYKAKMNKFDPGNDPWKSLKHPLWLETNLNWPGDLPKFTSEAQFLNNFIQDIQAKGFYFPERIVRAFHTSLKVQGISALVILSGISGTGKSELPQLYAKYIGAEFLLLAVQPRWDSPQDLLGFYNYMENQFKPTPLIQGIYQYNRSPQLQNRLVLVLLDEMNLARVEYYFSEFLSKLETRRHHPAELEIDLGNCSEKLEPGDLHIPKQFLFVGTMNEDETTQTLSDKVLDRANVITFGKPSKLALISSPNGNASRKFRPVTYDQFINWIQEPDANSELVKHLEICLNKTNHIMAEMGHPFAHRVYQSIIYYIVNYPGVRDIKSEAFKWALADQFGQKILPKLRGLEIADDSLQENLAQLGGIISAIGEPNLEKAFHRACQGYQFQWPGLAYQ